MRGTISNELPSGGFLTDRPSFLRRQFDLEQTGKQRVFDVLAGIVGPLLCFYFDPIVFKGGILGPPLLGAYQFVAYSVTAVEVCLLVLWLQFGSRLRSGALVGGALIAGAVFSDLIGIVILPFSLLGLLFGGFLGFMPFLTGFVYLRSGFRALKSRQPDSIPRTWAAQMLWGGILALGLPALVSVQLSRTISSSVDIILNGNTTQAEVAVKHLKWLPLVPVEKLDVLIQAYSNEADPARKALLKQWYRDITGEDIDTRIRIIND
jgi:hypothetical protein